MKKTYFVLLLLLFAVGAHAQKSPLKYGDIPMEDLTMTSYAQDTSATAVYLLNYGEVHVESRVDDYKLVLKVHVRIKILNSNATEFSDVSIRLIDRGSSNAEKVIGLKGATYNLEGGKIVASPLDKENIFKVAIDKTHNRLKFTMPNVKVGSVIEYSYAIDSDFILDFPNWNFQQYIPIRKMEYWATVPSNWVFQKYMQGYLSPTYEPKQANAYGIDVNTHHWTMDNVPAFKKEPYMTSEEDYISQINFALSGVNSTTSGYVDYLGTWEKICTNLMEDESFGQIITKSGFLKDKADELTAGITDPLKKAEAIHNYVKKAVTWTGLEDFYGTSPKKLVEAKKGSSGDINLLLGSLLSKAGFDVNMILISTRDHGFIRRQSPMPRQFNYVVCTIMVGDKTIWLDATEPYLPINVLPERCLNGEGLIVSSKNSGWVEIPAKTKARTIINADFLLSPEGELKGKVGFSRDGYSAYEMRQAYADKGEAEYLKTALSGRTWKVEKSEFSDVGELTKPAKESHSVTIEEHASVAGDVIYINPFVDSKQDENPFKTETRIYPVDFGRPEETLYICKFTIPDGFTVDEIPKSKALALPGNAARFSYNATILGNTVNITSSVQINKVLYVPDEYAALREFFAQVIAKQDEQIVLKKK